MLTDNQKRYLQSIPQDKITRIEPFDPGAKQTGDQISAQVAAIFPDLKVLSIGSSNLGIAGQNDIDLNIPCAPADYEKFLPKLRELFGEPVKHDPRLVKWQFIKNKYTIELYLTDKDSPQFREQLDTFLILKNNPELALKYERLKLSCAGIPFREYMRQKYEFFNELLNSRDNLQKNNASQAVKKKQIEKSS